MPATVKYSDALRQQAMRPTHFWVSPFHRSLTYCLPLFCIPSKHKGAPNGRRPFARMERWVTQFRWTDSHQLFSQCFLMTSLKTIKTFEMVFSFFLGWGLRSNLNPRVSVVLKLIIIAKRDKHGCLQIRHWIRTKEVHHPILLFLWKNKSAIQNE